MTPSQKHTLELFTERGTPLGVKVEFVGYNKWNPEKIMIKETYPDQTNTEQICIVGKRGACEWGIRL